MGLALLKETNRTAYLAWGAIATLKGIMFYKGQLDGMEFSFFGYAFNGSDFGTVFHDCQAEAAKYSFSVTKHCAGTALAVVTAFLRAK